MNNTEDLKPRVLIVEDEAVLALSLANQTKRFGYTPLRPVASGEEAVERALAERPDLILMDIQLTGALDGIAAAERIRASLDVPIIYLTAFSEDDRLARAGRTDPYAYLIKPVPEQELRATLAMTLYKHKADRALRESEERFRVLTALSSDWYWEQDAQFRFTRMSGSLQERTGISINNHIGRTRWELPHLDVEGGWDAHRALLDRHEPFRELVIRRVEPDGTTHWVSISGNALFDAGGTFVGYRGTGREITAQKHAELLNASSRRVLGMVVGGDPLDAVLDRLMRDVEHLAPGLLASILLLDEDGAHLRHGAAPSLPPDYNRAIDGAAIGPRAGSCGTAAWRKVEVIVEDIASDPLWADYRALALSHGLRACWSIPVCNVQGTVLGTFALYYREPRLPNDWHRTLIGHVVSLAATVIERNRSEARTRKLAHAVEQSPVSIFMTDREGNIEYVNPAFCEVTGYAAAEVLGRNPRLLQSGETSRQTYAELWDTIMRGEVWKGELKNRRKDGSLFWELARISSIRERDGALGGFVAVKQDITALKHTEAEIRALNDTLERHVAERTVELERAYKDLDAFAYSVSHDLRAPLRAINGFAHLLLEAEEAALGPESKDHLNRIVRSANRMGQLIDDVLAFSRAGRAQPERYETDMTRLARQSVAEQQGDYPQAAVDVGTLPEARGDAAMLQQVWANLIGNALKYSAKREEPRVSIGFDPARRGGAYFVRDNGAGFDMAYAGKLFGVFQRMHTDKEFPGTGVGLAITKRIVERHGGDIWAEAAPNRGAAFYFTLP